MSASLELAIETSTKQSSVTVGRGEELLETIAIPPQRRHNVALMPTIAAMFERQGGGPADLATLHVSVGPGSFTGLRVGIATAKALSLATGCRVTAVPTLDVLACNVTEPLPRLAVALNQKQQTVYCAVYEPGEAVGDSLPNWSVVTPPAVRTIDELMAAAGEDTPLLAALLPEGTNANTLPTELAQPRSEVVYRPGRRSAAAEQFTDPAALVPEYGRPPEAVTIWADNQKRAGPWSPG